MIKKKILITTGGTGGHIFPAIGLAKNLIEKNYDLRLTIDGRGLKYLDNSNKINFTKISSSPLEKKNFFTLIKSVFIICFSITKSLFLLSLYRPKLVVGMGGYSSFPICFAALILRIKFVIYENNLIIGKANKFLSKFAEKIFVSYKDLEGIADKNKKKIVEVGNIIREEIINLNIKNNFNKKFDINNILILGGSQGARVFADKIPQIFKKIKDEKIPIKIFQQCHPDQKEKLSNFYNNEGIDYEIFDFTNKITYYYAQSNLVITRSGASALGELINIKIPFIAIPLPTSADNHQFKNAKFYEKRGLCFLLEEKNISKNLYELINLIFKDNKKIKKITSNQSQYSDKDVYNNLYFNIEKILNEKN